MASGIRAFVNEYDVGISASNWSFDEDATPRQISDTTGGTSQINLEVSAYKNSDFAFDKILRIESDRGTTTGVIKEINENKGRCSFTADSILNLFNVSRTVQPVVTEAIDNQAVNPSVINNLNYYAGSPGPSGSGSLTRNTTDIGFGPGTAMFSWTIATTSVDGGIYYQHTGLITPLQNYTFSGYVRSSKTQRMALKIQWRSASGATISTVSGSEVVVSANVNARLSYSGAAPANAVTAFLLFYSTAGTSGSVWSVGNTLRVDAIMITSGSTLWDYRDGNNSNWVWLSDAGSSASRGLPVLGGVTPQRTLEDAWRYYATSVCGMPSAQVTIDPSLASIPFIAEGWNGNVWTRMKEMASVYKAEIALVWSSLLKVAQVTMRPLRTRSLSLLNSQDFSRSIDKSNLANFIEVNGRNAVAKGGGICYPESGKRTEGTVIQVDANETVRQRFKTNMSMTSINQPRFVEQILPNPYIEGSGAGVYTVIGKDNLPITAEFWNGLGGKVSVALTENPFEIEVTVKGPSSKANGPFRLAESDGSTTYPALYITGNGVQINPELFRAPTAVVSGETSQEVGIQVDSPFITDKAKMFTAASQCIEQYGLLTSKVAASVPYASSAGASEFGFVAGSMIDFRNSRFRVSTSKFQIGRVALDAPQYVTIDDFSLIWGAKTISDFSAVYGSGNIKEFALEPLRKP